MTGQSKLYYKIYAALNVERLVTEGGTTQRLLGTKIEHHHFQSNRNRHFPHHKGDHLFLAFDSRLGIARNRKYEDEFTAWKQKRKEMKTRML